MFNEINLDKIDLNSAPPTEEPQRQYYFIERAKRRLAELSAKAGRPLTFCVTTFGCQMNARDSEKLVGILEQVGYVEEPEEEKADFVIYNTCTVRENANQRVYGRLGQLGRAKKKNPYMMIGLCGCMMQEPHVVEKLKKSWPWLHVRALGTNSGATARMLKAGADDGATGENAIVVNAGKAQMILGVVTVLAANGLLGEITPAMGKDARWVAGYTAHNYGAPLCAACAQKRKEAAQKASEAEPPAAPGEEEEEPL